MGEIENIVILWTIVGVEWLGVKRAADESSSSLCWCLAFTASTLHSLCPDVFLNARARGWMVEVWLWIVAGDPSES